MLQSCFYKNIAARSRGRVLQEALGTPGAPRGRQGALGCGGRCWGCSPNRLELQQSQTCAHTRWGFVVFPLCMVPACSAWWLLPGLQTLLMLADGSSASPGTPSSLPLAASC